MRAALLVYYNFKQLKPSPNRVFPMTTTATNSLAPAQDLLKAPVIDASASELSKSTFVTLGKRARKPSLDECGEY